MILALEFGGQQITGTTILVVTLAGVTLYALLGRRR